MSSGSQLRFILLSTTYQDRPQCFLGDQKKIIPTDVENAHLFRLSHTFDNTTTGRVDGLFDEYP